MHTVYLSERNCRHAEFGSNSDENKFNNIYNFIEMREGMGQSSQRILTEYAWRVG
jgi:hypothetical protein